MTTAPESGTTIVQRCANCKPHPFQDETYGSRMRVKNQIVNKASEKKIYRCTVCGDES